MPPLLPTLNKIIQFGLEANASIPDKEKVLEQNLVKLYALSFEITYTFDEAAYPDFDKSQFPDIRENVSSNFKDFGFYKTILDINDFENLNDIAFGDAVDDLSDIITDLLEIKWRIENNSLDDGLWYFEFIFRAHTQQHILDLLNYLKLKNG